MAFFLLPCYSNKRHSFFPSSPFITSLLPNNVATTQILLPQQSTQLPLTSNCTCKDLLGHFWQSQSCSPSSLARGRVVKARAAGANGKGSSSSSSGLENGDALTKTHISKSRRRRKKVKEEEEVGSDDTWIGVSKNEVPSRLSPSDAESSGSFSSSAETSFSNEEERMQSTQDKCLRKSSRSKRKEDGSKPELSNGNKQSIESSTSPLLEALFPVQGHVGGALPRKQGSKEVGKMLSSRQEQGELMRGDNEWGKPEKSQNSEGVSAVSRKEGYETEDFRASQNLQQRAVRSRRKLGGKTGNRPVKKEKNEISIASIDTDGKEEKDDRQATKLTSSPDSLQPESGKKNQTAKYNETAKDAAKTIKREDEARETFRVTAQASGDLVVLEPEEPRIESLPNEEARNDENGDEREPTLEVMNIDGKGEFEEEKQSAKSTQSITVKRTGKRIKPKPRASRSKSEEVSLNSGSQIIEEAECIKTRSPALKGKDLIEEAEGKSDDVLAGNISALTEVVAEARSDAKALEKKGRKKSRKVDLQAEKNAEAEIGLSWESNLQSKSPLSDANDPKKPLPAMGVNKLDKLIDFSDSTVGRRKLTKQKEVKNLNAKALEESTERKCLVFWQVDSKVEHGHRLYLTGANPELGSWDPVSAVPLVEIPDKANNKCIWQGSVLVQYDTDLEYNYFMQPEGGDFKNLLKKLEPPLHFLVPANKLVVIKDTWVWYVRKQLPFLSWGSWWEEIALQQSHEKSSQKTFIVSEDATTTQKKEVSESYLEEAKQLKIVGVEDEVQVEIIINSSECTMQRIAIVEDGKLVQLLLEPVYANVQVGNIYLGIVKQILPGMNGFFVDIGGSRVGLMSISLEFSPYTFPPFGHIDLDAAEKGNGTLASHNHEKRKLVPEAGDYEEEDEGEEMEGEELEEECRDDYNAHDTLQEFQEHSQEDHEDEEYHYHATKQFLSQFCNKEGSDGRTLNDVVSQVAEKSPSPKNVGLQLGLEHSDLETTDASFYNNSSKWKLEEGMKIVVQVKKEALGKKGPRLTAFPSLAGRFLVLETRTTKVGVSKKILGQERTRLKSIAQSLKPVGLGVTVRTAAVGRDSEELEKDLARVLGTWKEVLDRADAAAAAAASGVESAVPVLLHRAMGQTLRTVRDVFNDDVQKMVVDSSQSYQEVTGYLQEIAPHLCDRVELYTGNVPIFDAFNLETEIDKFSSKRVNLPNGAYLVLEETEALVSVDVNGGAGMLGQNTMRMDAVLEVNLAAARQIATELRLRDVGGIIVVDFMNMEDQEHERLVYEEMRKAIQRDPSKVAISEISEYGLMEITRKRVRPSVTCTISEACSFCRGTGRVESPEATLSKIEREIKRHLVQYTSSIRPYFHTCEEFWS
ncbi:hypothetical protein O6H91_03G065100 [Diphasiastrum complanatum]|uniref:Uncharacterized protein n=1 Tax=Diphasiastrum complanatum TaxID=34168 RepID=A0ACC2E7U9_DIPCM|nr:hypothetical protein O6H91_03G065100 [Diphasiastrum complanatum]